MVGQIDSLTYKTGIDAKGWSQGIDEGLKKFDDFDKNIKSKLDSMSIPAPKVEAPKAGSGGGMGAETSNLASQLLPLAGKIQSAIASAVTPLSAFASRFSAQFEQVGATIIAMAKKVDAHLKFPTFEKGITAARLIIKKNFSDMEGAAGRYARIADMALGGTLLVAKVNRFIATVGGLKKKIDDFRNIKPLNIDTKKAENGILGVNKAAQAATNSVKGMGIQIGLALGLFGLGFKAVEFLKDGIKGASDLNETITKTDAILGTASDGVKAFADTMATKFGLVKQETLDIASGIGGLAKGLGKLQGKDLEDLTTTFTKLAADLSSFKNIGFAEAGKALQIGLSGEQSDQLKALGVVMTEDTVKAYAYANGIAKVGKELTNQQKLMARAGVIQKALADASGDLDKTSDGTANQFRKFTGTITNLGTSLGTVLLPIVTKVIGIFNQLAEKVIAFFEGSKGSASGFFEAFENGLSLISAGINNWQAVMEVARLKIIQGLANIGEYFETLGPNIGIIAEYIANNWSKLLIDAFNLTYQALLNLGNNFYAFADEIGKFINDPTQGFHPKWTGLLDGFEATAAKLPELLKPHLTDLTREINAAAKPITDEVNRKAAAAKKHAEEMAKAGSKEMPKEQTAEEQERQKNLASFAKGIKDKVQSPLNKLIHEFAQIEEAAQKGLLNKAEAAKAKVQVAEEAGFGGPSKRAGAFEAGSTEARSLILDAIGQTGGKDKVEDNTRKAAGYLSQLLELQQAALRVNQQPRTVVQIP